MKAVVMYRSSEQRSRRGQRTDTSLSLDVAIAFFLAREFDGFHSLCSLFLHCIVLCIDWNSGGARILNSKPEI